MINTRRNRRYALCLAIFWSWIVAGVFFSSVVWTGALPSGDQPPTVSFERNQAAFTP